jgi:hypothetical protein
VLRNCRNCKKKAKVWRKWKIRETRTQPKLGGQWRTEFLATNYIRTLQHPPYSLDLVPADYSLFWRIKSDLADVSITHETFKTELERVLRSIGENEFTGAFQRWLHMPWKVHCPPGWICREILKNKVPPISYSFCFIGPFAFVIEHTSYEEGSPNIWGNAQIFNHI